MTHDDTRDVIEIKFVLIAFFFVAGPWFYGVYSLVRLIL